MPFAWGRLFGFSKKISTMILKFIPIVTPPEFMKVDAYVDVNPSFNNYFVKYVYEFHELLIFHSGWLSNVIFLLCIGWLSNVMLMLCRRNTLYWNASIFLWVENMWKKSENCLLNFSFFPRQRWILWRITRNLTVYLNEQQIPFSIHYYQLVLLKWVIFLNSMHSLFLFDI